MGIKIYPPQIYLDIARSISYFGGSEDTLKSDEGFNFAFGIASIKCIYSYMAIEAFVNAFLEDLWKKAKINHDAFDRAPVLRKKGCVPEFDDFWKEYCCEKDLDHLWKQELKEKIKIICKAMSKTPLSEANPVLWDKFIKFLRDRRHFNVHMRPASDFHEQINKMLTPEVVSSWDKIATEIMLYLRPELADKNWQMQKSIINIPVAEFLGGGLNR